MDRQIVCFQIPSFEIALARLETASLRSRPVAIAPLHTPRACLHEVSREAQDDGLRPGMTVDVAHRLCPSLRLIPPDPLRVRQAQHCLENIVARFAPVWEPVRPGHVFLDLTGTTRLFGATVDTALRIEQELTRRHGLTGIMGIASNKLVSHVAAVTLAQPPKCRDVQSGSERTFLAPFPVSILPGLSRTVARKALAILDDLNLQTLGQIAEVPLPELELALGRPAKILHRWAYGIDPSPVLPPVQYACIDIPLELEPDEIDDGLSGLLYEPLERLCRQLRRCRQICRRLTLIVRYSDHVQVSRSHMFKPGMYWETDMYPHLKTLFFRCFQRRVRLRTMTISAEVTDVSGAPGEQLSLFDGEPTREYPTSHHDLFHPPPMIVHPLSHPPVPQVRRDAPFSHGPSWPRPAPCPRSRAHRLAVALDRVRERFGEQSVWWGRSRVLH
jgi:DNA polymerase-4